MTKSGFAALTASALFAMAVSSPTFADDAAAAVDTPTADMKSDASSPAADATGDAKSEPAADTSSGDKAAPDDGAAKQ